MEPFPMDDAGTTESRIDDAPLRIEIVQTIKPDVDRVWEMIADNDRWTEWFPGFAGCAWEAPDTAGRPGAHRLVRQPPFRVREEITAWEAPHHWAMRVVDIKPRVLASMEETIDLEPDGDGTRITWRLGAKPAVWIRPFAALLRRDQERKLRAAIAALDALEPAG